MGTRLLFLTDPKLRRETFFLRRSIAIVRSQYGSVQPIVFKTDVALQHIGDALTLGPGLLHWAETALKIAEIDALALLTKDYNSPTSIQMAFILAAYRRRTPVVEKAFNYAHFMVHPLPSS